LEVPEWWRRWLDIDDRTGWLRTEEFHEGDTLVVRAEMPGLDPDKDIEVSVYADGILEVRVPCPAEKEPESKKVPVSRS